jgi:hypothetical protein
MALTGLASFLGFVFLLPTKFREKLLSHHFDAKIAVIPPPPSWLAPYWTNEKILATAYPATVIDEMEPRKSGNRSSSGNHFPGL